MVLYLVREESNEKNQTKSGWHTYIYIYIWEEDSVKRVVNCKNEKSES